MRRDAFGPAAGAGLLVALSVGLPSPGHAQGLISRLRGGVAVPACPPPTTVKELARYIDQLDEDLFDYGKVTVKGPDVWGQNRMTQYCAEYEDRMKAQLDKFEVILSSYQRRADIAALASTTAIGAGTARTQITDSENVTTTNVTTPSPTGLPALGSSAGALVGAYPASPLLAPDMLTRLALSNTGAVPGIGLEPMEMIV